MLSFQKDFPARHVLVHPLAHFLSGVEGGLCGLQPNPLPGLVCHIHIYMLLTFTFRNGFYAKAMLLKSSASNVSSTERSGSYDYLTLAYKVYITCANRVIE